MWPDVVYERRVPLGNVSHVVTVGHRIRLHVTLSNFRRWDRNTDTDDLTDRRDNRGMIGHVERDGQDGVAELDGEVFQGVDVAGGRGDFVATTQGRLVQLWPKPREAPVMNQVLLMGVFLPHRGSRGADG
jgi:hypothetical protein